MPPAAESADFRCDTLAIIGVGLLGGAVALQAKARGGARTVIGLGRNPSRLEAAQRAGVIDRCATNVRDLAGTDLAIVCTPVDRIVDDVNALAALSHPPSLITDVGSVKGPICSALKKVTQFVGSHPLAGSEKKGFEHADEVSLEGRVCVITASPAKTTAAEPIQSFWRSLGMQVVAMDSGRHDEILARTSHFPHVAAYALASLLKLGDEPFVAGGFRDTTRIAASDPELWAAILLMNREAVQRTIVEYEGWLRELSGALSEGNPHPLAELLEAGRAARGRIRPEVNRE